MRPTPSSAPAVTLFGSTNLNSRSANLDTELSFVLVSAGVTGVLMLGWRALALYLTRGERRTVRASAVQQD